MPKKRQKNEETATKVPTTGWQPLALDPHTMGDCHEGGLCGIEVLDVEKCENLESYGYLATPADPTTLPFLKQRSKKKKKRKKQHKTERPIEEEKETEVRIGSEEELSDAWRDLDLHPSLLSAIKECGFAFPLPIQSYCIPAAVKQRRDVLGAAQTGSGKTLAFGIPIFQRLLQERSTQPPTSTPCSAPLILIQPKKNEGRENANADEDEMIEIESTDSISDGCPTDDAEQMEISDSEMASLHQRLGTVYYSDLFRKEDPTTCLKALILTPTRELALQAHQHLKAIGAHTNIRVVPVVGDHPEIVVATPGRFLDLYKKGIPHLRDLSQLEFFVVDECDKMIRHGDFRVILSLSQRNREETRLEETYDAKEKKGKSKRQNSLSAFRIPAEDRKMQTLLFSATLTLPRSLHRKLRPSKRIPPEEDIDDMALALDQLRFRGEPAVIDLTSKAKMAEKVQEAYILCPEETVDAVLYSILMKYPGRTLVFCNAIKSVRQLTETLRLLNVSAQPIHAAKQQSQRLKALERFAADQNAVLVATDVAARGLDISDVRCVIHYNVPRAADLYIHRSGRTARVEADGLALSLVVPSEVLRFQSLFHALGRKLPPLFPLDQSPIQECVYRMKLAKKIRVIDTKRRMAKKDAVWTNRAAKTLQTDIIRLMFTVDKTKTDAMALCFRSSDEECGNEVEDDEMKETRERLSTVLARRLVLPLNKKLQSKYLTGPAIPLPHFLLYHKVLDHTGNLLPGAKGTDSATKKRVSSAFKETLQKVNAPEREVYYHRGSVLSVQAQEIYDIQMQNPKKKSPSRFMSVEDRIGRHRAKLKEILDKKIDKKHKVKSLSYTKQKLFVIPPVLGREAQGPDALQAMKNHMKSKRG